MYVKSKKGFTLVELLAVLVILAIILVIAVPKVMSIIKDVRISTLESTAKLVALSAEKKKIENEIIGNNEILTCENVVKINDIDYESCYIEFIDNKAVVTIIGSGTFKGMNACEATKNNANVTERCLNKKVEVTLELNGGSAPDITGIYKEGTVIDLEEPIKENSTFTSYEIVSGNSVITNNKLTIGSTNTIIHAFYESWPSLEIDLDGGIDNTDYKEKYKSGSIIELEKPMKEGYIFRGWRVKEGNGIISGNTFTMGSENSLVEAIWEGPMTDGVYIMSIEPDNVDSILINSINKTEVNSKIILDNSNLRLKITVYNSSNEDYFYVGNSYEKLYDNSNIEFEIEGLKTDDVILSKSYLTFYVNFKYKNTNTQNNVLNSTIEYIFKPFSMKETLSGIEFNYLIKNGIYAPEGDVYEYYSIDANRLEDHTVKIIVFGKSSDYIGEVSGLTALPIDFYRTGSINLYRKKLNDGTDKIYILSNTGNFILNENAAWMFDKLYVLEEIINLHLLDTSNVTNMRDMFCDCPMLKNVDLSNFDTSKVTNMIGMFARMTELKYLDLSTFNTSNLKEMGQMFSSSENIKKIYVSNLWNLSNVELEGGVGVFSNCKSLVGGNGTIYDSTKITYNMANTSSGYLTNGYSMDTGINVNHVIKNKSASEIENWTLSTRFVDTKVKSITFGKYRDYDDIISGYTGASVDLDNSGVISVYRVPNGSNYDVYILSNSGKFKANTDSSWLFDNLVLLENINNLHLLDTSNVTNMRDMFCDVQTITTLDLSNFNTSKVTSMVGMFARTYNIVSLDLSSFDTSKLTTLQSMFVLTVSEPYTYEKYLNIVPKLKTIYVSSKWDVSSLSNETVFANNVNLVGGNNTIFDSSKVTREYAKVDEIGSVGYFTKK